MKNERLPKQEEPNFWMEFKFPSPQEDNIPVVIATVSAATKEYFREGISKNNEKWHYNLLSAVLEAVKNSSERGNNLDPGKSVILEIKFWKDKVSVGIKDEGKFYENTQIQKCVNKKQKFPKKLAPPHPNSCDFGMDIIYETTESVFVDEGKLVLVFKRPSKGQNGY